MILRWCLSLGVILLTSKNVLFCLFMFFYVTTTHHKKLIGFKGVNSPYGGREGDGFQLILQKMYRVVFSMQIGKRKGDGGSVVLSIFILTQFQESLL